MRTTYAAIGILAAVVLLAGCDDDMTGNHTGVSKYMPGGAAIEQKFDTEVDLAVIALRGLVNTQKAFFARKRQYCPSLTELGVPPTSSGYTIAITQASAQGFTAVATPTNPNVKMPTITIDQTGKVTKR